MPRLDWKRPLGELAIVVAGVLIALTVDEWRDDLFERTVEQSYLESLATDLRTDLAQIDTAVAWTTRHQREAEAVLGFLRESRPLEPDTLLLSVAVAGWQDPPTFTTYTIDDLRSTGNLRVLRNHELRRVLADYYRSLQQYQRTDARFVERIWREYDGRVRQVLSPQQRVRALEMVYGPQPVAEGFLDGTALDPEAVRRAFAADPDLASALDEVVYVAVSQRDYLGEIADGARSTLESVEAELRRF